MIGIIQADARRIPLGDETVQCVVTSPPYWGLRKYSGAQDLLWGGAGNCEHTWNSNGTTEHHPDRNTGGKDGNGSGTFVDGRDQGAKKARGVAAPLGDTCVRCGGWRGGFGLEPTIEMYLAHTVEILRELRRVLRPDGVLFWNIGDSYAGRGSRSSNPGGTGELSKIQKSNRGSYSTVSACAVTPPGMKPKDLCLIPERVAIAAQADGWWCRSMIIWAKPNPMPESCADRPADAYEHIIMLTKSERYFWDPDAVREPTTGDHRNNNAIANRGGGIEGRKATQRGSYQDWEKYRRPDDESSRNLRNVWTFPTQPYKGAHFATFPEEIPRRCILAATSERGACRQCGTPWKRITEKETHLESGSGKAAEKRVPSGWHQAGTERMRSEHVETFRHNGGKNSEPDAAHKDQTKSGDYDIRMGPVNEIKTVGWKPGCECFAAEHRETSPCMVLDPFGGSGTTARVAIELNRRAVSFDLAYHDHAEKRTRNVQRNLIQT